ncbi:lysophospholipase L1-like esterase [Allocatelliglobosispora scoriae]|uniref:Lysophospholipase L1-like esterase n=1 Tax=Allocatelliglobosispora scoriae TaxID=643052 RepID=A0A841BVT6_9ACTN|nr:SGNH/GDSL hydrolase family protein [Allocatelliglobosispora scoriae]MBB5871033.1 lysophospholipase L1-like esterase [Allocatelliglobosispora scoriae]
MAWSRYAALGDSFTEGMDDPHPATPGIFRGWADLVAGELSKLTPDFGYANLAVRGRLFDRIVTEQVGPVLEMKPDLISFAAGGNDVLRRNCDPPTLMKRFEGVIGELRGSGADVLIFRFADVMSRLPGNKLIAPRILYLNEAVGEIAERQGARLVDLWADGEFANPAMWSTDRLHMSLFGHQRVAAHVLTKLDVPPPAQWWELPPWPGRKSWARTRADDIQWAGKHLAPWVKRRLQGRSSGDNVMPKRPTLGPLT